MKDFVRKHWPLLLAALLILTNAWLTSWLESHRGKPDKTERIDSMTYVDTIPFLVPTARDSLVLRYDTLRVPLEVAHVTYDSVAGDSVVEIGGIPMTQKVYRDTGYIAWVSGYRPCLDSIRVMERTHYVTRTVTLTKPPERRSRLVVGPCVGYGVSFDGRPCPYIGVGLCYNLFGFH